MVNTTKSYIPIGNTCKMCSSVCVCVNVAGREGPSAGDKRLARPGQ